MVGVRIRFCTRPDGPSTIGLARLPRLSGPVPVSSELPACLGNMPIYTRIYSHDFVLCVRAWYAGSYTATEIRHDGPCDATSNMASY